MNTRSARPLPLSAAFLFAAAALVPATETRAQAPDVRAEMGLALRAETPEEAARLLRHAWLLAGLIDKDRERRSLQGEVEDKLREVDRKGLGVARDLQRMLEDLRDAAKDYSDRGWHETAESLLHTAARILPEAVKEDLEAIARKRADHQPTEAAAAPGENDVLMQWLESGRNPYGGRDFAVSEEGIDSPALEEGKTQGWLSRHVLAGDGRVSLQIGMGGTIKGRAGVVFSQTDANELFRYYLAEIEHEDGVVNLIISRIDGSNVVDLALEKVNWTCPKDVHWHEVELFFAGRCVVMQVDDHPTVATAPMLQPNEGAIGLFVAGSSEYKDPVRFRHLIVETLTPHSLK